MAQPTGSAESNETGDHALITDSNKGTETINQDTMRQEIQDIKIQLQQLILAFNNALYTRQPENGVNVADGNGPEREVTTTDASALDTTTQVSGNATTVDLLSVIVQTQQLAETLRQSTRPLHVHSTSDTSHAIPTFEGESYENVAEWLREIERVALLANWTPNLTLLNAVTRLHGAARDWHKSYGSRIDDWEVWKEAIKERFQRKMGLQQFLEYQQRRQLRHNESIVQYIYAKNAMLERAPCELGASERISLILHGITEDKWANPLAAQGCKSVLELIDCATTLDHRRPREKTQPRKQGMHEHATSTQQTTGAPTVTPTKAPSPKPFKRTRQSNCFNCDQPGHFSRDCPEPKTAATIRAEEKRAQKGTGPNDKNVHCFLRTTGDSLPIVTAFTEKNRPLKACIDTGANISIIDPRALPQDACVSPWSRAEEFVNVLDNKLTPDKCTSLTISVGSTTVKVPEILILPLPKSIDLLLGSDWRQLANVEVTFHVSNDITIVQLPRRHDSPGEIPKTTISGEALVSNFHEKLPQTERLAMFVKFEPARNDIEAALMQRIHTAVDSITEDASPEERERLFEILTKHHAAFTTVEEQLGTCPHAEHSIELRDEIPVASRPYRCSPADREFIKRQVEDYRERGIVRKSQSEYAAPTLVVNQPKDETTRLHRSARQRHDAKDNLENSQASAKSRYDARSKTPRFKIGDSVYCSIGARSSTMDPFFESPFEIKSFPSPNTVVIKRLHSIKGRQNERKANVEQLRRHNTRTPAAPELSDTCVGRALSGRADQSDEREDEDGSEAPTRDKENCGAANGVEDDAAGQQQSRTRRPPAYLADYALE